MKAEFMADVNGVTEGMAIEAGIEPPAVVHANGTIDDEVSFSLSGTASRDAGSWYGKRVKVTVETIGDE